MSKSNIELKKRIKELERLIQNMKDSIANPKEFYYCVWALFDALEKK